MGKPQPRAAGGVRISELAGRGKEDKNGKNGKRLHSDDDQREKLHSICEEFGLDLNDADVFEEFDTSGTLPLREAPEAARRDRTRRARRLEGDRVSLPRPH